MSFDLSDYVDVAERIRIFREKHPNGSLQSEVTIYTDPDGRPTGVLAKAYAYRSPEDIYPGTGHSWMSIPGETSYTKGSEVENAETSAFGRAMVASLTVEAKRVASQDEVRAKTGGAVTSGGDSRTAGTTSDFTLPFGKHKGKQLSEVPDDYLDWILQQEGKFDDIKERINAMRSGAVEEELVAAGALEVDPFEGADDDIPF